MKGVLSMRILLAEDEPHLRSTIVRGLTEQGYAVDPMADGDAAWLAVQITQYDVVILDINLPGINGFALCRLIRQQIRPDPALLFVTARDGIDDRVRGLDLGAEDYLVKPFAFAELLARIRSLLRRGPSAAPVLSVADLELDPAKHTVHRGRQSIRLTAKEFAVLEYLMRNAGAVLTKTMIADHVWNFDLDAESNFIEVVIYSLRKKLSPAAEPSLIETLRGVGYRISPSYAD
jgi:DNA-binding response OmpR family regulator